MSGDLASALLARGIRIGSRWSVAGTVHLETPVNVANGCGCVDVELGAYTYLMPGTFIRRAKVGRFCSVAADVRIGPDQHPTHGLTTSSFPFDNDRFAFFDGLVPKESWNGPGRTCIGNDVWIGEGALIMTGVTIGDGAVIGAKSVVTRDVEPYAIAVGTPARTVRRRFDDDLIAAVRATRWWDYGLPSWLNTRKDLRSIPLSLTFLDEVRAAIVQGDLPLLSPVRTTLEASNGEVRLFTHGN